MGSVAAGGDGEGRHEARGRSVLVAPGQAAPPGWAEAERWDGDGATLERAWRERVPLVIEADADPEREPVDRRAVWSLSPSFAFADEARHLHMFDNSVDAREGRLRWHWGEAALELGARPGGAADVLLADGSPAFVDGGPLRWQPSGPSGLSIPAVTVAAGSLAPLGGNETTAELAADQRAAVTHPAGAARIIAPAGSGKTRVLTERARHLLGVWGVPARAVTLLAFNKRAAEEMVARTADLPALRVRTLNSMALSVVNSAGRVSTIDESEVRRLLERLVPMPRRANTDPATAWMEALSAVRLGLSDPAEVEADFGGDVPDLAAVFDRYRAELRSRSLVDFDEQVYRAIEVLLTDPAVRRTARSYCRVLLVDEFQDLTPAHLLLIRLLAGPAGEVFGVGDDDQTIYGYAKASPRWLIDYRRYFPGAGEHALTVNYRCPPPVVRAAATLLTHNRVRVPKSIVASAGRSDDPADLAVLGGHDPVGASVERVKALLGAAAPRDVAVLARVNAALAPVQVALVGEGVPVRAVIDQSYLSRGGVAAALGWLRLANADGGRLGGSDIAAAARRPSRGLSPRVMEWMAEQGDLAGLQRLAARLRDRDGQKVEAFVADLIAVRRVASRDTRAIFETVRDQVGLEKAMETLQVSRRRLDRSAQTDDLDALCALADLHPDPAGFEGWLRDILGRPGAPGGVTLATIHSVKGREWPHVVVHDVSARLLPHRLADDVEEERRLLHVAITRCARSVAVVAGGDPSPFIAEMATPLSASSLRAPSPEGRPTRGARTAPAAATSSGRAGRSGRPASVVATAVSSDPGASRAVSEALRQWRGQRARAEGKPAYIYLSDATVEAVAAALPADAASLVKVKGIGPAKAAAFGDVILAIVASCLPPGG